MQQSCGRHENFHSKLNHPESMMSQIVEYHRLTRVNPNPNKQNPQTVIELRLASVITK